MAGARSGSQDEQRVLDRMEGGRGKKGRAGGCWGLARWEGGDTTGHGGAAEHGGFEKWANVQARVGRGWGAVSPWDPGVQISEESHPPAREGGLCVLPRPLAGGRARAPPRASVTRLLLRTLGAPLPPRATWTLCVSWKQTL